MLFNAAKTVLVLLLISGCSDDTVSTNVTPGEPGVTPGGPGVTPSGPDILATHNFNDGTFGPYTLSFNQDIDIVDDPTGSGRGKVARMHYKGVDQDRNRALVYTKVTAIGQDMFFKGDFYIPANASTTNISRKLNYWQSEHWGSAPAFYSVLGMFGSEASNDNNYQKQDQSLDYTNNPVRRPSIGGIAGNGHYTFGVWHTLETQVNLGSKLGARDGIFRQWLDGVLLYEETSKQWTDAAWTADPSTIHFYLYEVGDQVNGYNGVPFDEYRYWDNVSFGRKRIP